MNAESFYNGLHAGIKSAGLPGSFTSLAGTNVKLKAATAVGMVQFTCSTNPRVAGLLALNLWPGEFRLICSWTKGRGPTRVLSEFNFLQYIERKEASAVAALQRSALNKYLVRGGADPHGTLRTLADNESRLPEARIAEWCYYSDKSDAEAWGEWYGAAMPRIVDRFTKLPESYDDWCWRVLWGGRKAQGAEA